MILKLGIATIRFASASPPTSVNSDAKRQHFAGESLRFSTSGIDPPASRPALVASPKSQPRLAPEYHHHKFINHHRRSEMSSRYRGGCTRRGTACGTLPRPDTRTKRPRLLRFPLLSWSFDSASFPLFMVVEGNDAGSERKKGARRE